MERIRIQAPYPSTRKLQEVVQFLQAGAVIAYPTDSLFAIGCDPWQKKAVITLCKMKGIDPTKANLSYLCLDMASASQLIKQMDKEVFKFVNRNTPGPITFVLEASKEVPHHFRNKRKTIGIRIPNHYFLKQLLQEFGRPILTTSLASDQDQELMYPDELVQLYQSDLAVWIDDEKIQKNPSTIIDCTHWPYEFLRDGGQDIVL